MVCMYLYREIFLRVINKFIRQSSCVNQTKKLLITHNLQELVNRISDKLTPLVLLFQVQCDL